MPVEAIGTQHQVLHEGHVPRRHVEIFALARQSTRLRRDGRAHEHRVAVLIVIGHRLLHVAVGVEAEIGNAPNQLHIARIAGAAG